MAKPNIVLSGYAATLFVQSASGAPLTTTQLGTKTNVETIVTTGIQLPVEAIPAFGFDDAVATYSVAGSRTGDKIPVQSQNTSMTITAAWNPNDSALAAMQTDAYSGQAERTYVVKATDGTNSIYYAFNARVGSFQIDMQPNAEAKCVFTVHPRGGQYGWSNT